MFFDPFTHRRTPTLAFPKEEVRCWRCGLRFIKHHNVRPNGSGLCRYCEAASIRKEHH